MNSSLYTTECDIKCIISLRPTLIGNNFQYDVYFKKHKEKYYRSPYSAICIDHHLCQQKNCVVSVQFICQ
jgi:hypothetical protein